MVSRFANGTSQVQSHRLVNTRVSVEFEVRTHPGAISSPAPAAAAIVVEHTVGDDEVNLNLDERRTPASLEYLLTELVCAVCGGLEVPTAPSLKAAKLALSSDELWTALACVMRAADHIEPEALRGEVRKALFAARDDRYRTIEPDEERTKMTEDVERVSRRRRRGGGGGRGVVYFAKGRATKAQEEECDQLLVDLGFVDDSETPDVKSADAAASGGGTLLTSDRVCARGIDSLSLPTGSPLLRRSVRST